MINTKYKVAKYALYALLGYLFTVLQNTPNLFAIVGIKPALTAARVVSVAMMEGEFGGGLFAAGAGLLCDAFSYNKFGYNGLMFFLACVLIGLLVQSYMRPVLVNAALFSFLTVLFTESVSFFFRVFIRGYEGGGHLYLVRILPQCLYTAVWTVPIFLLVRWVHELLDRRIEA